MSWFGRPTGALAMISVPSGLVAGFVTMIIIWPPWALVVVVPVAVLLFVIVTAAL